MTNDVYIENLVKLGLSLREARVYLTLLNRKNYTAKEISTVSGIQNQKIYTVLRNLINKDMCIEKTGKIKQYKAVEPDIVFKSLIERYKRDFKFNLNKKQQIAVKLTNNLSALYNKNVNRNDPIDYIEVLKDIAHIRNKWLYLLKNAKKEVLVFNKPPSSIPITHTENLNNEIYSLNKKVKFKGIYEYDEIIKSQETLKVISMLNSKGEDVRVVDDLPMKLAIFDNRITMLALNDTISLKPSITTMIINHESFAKAQKYVFQSIWEKATPFEKLNFNK